MHAGNQMAAEETSTVTDMPMMATRGSFAGCAGLRDARESGRLLVAALSIGLNLGNSGPQLSAQTPEEAGRSNQSG